MSIDLIGGVVLLLVFVLGTTTRANLGALGLVASFAFGTIILGESAGEVFGGFPVTIFVLFLGVTYLFSVAMANGTTDWIIGRAIRLTGGRSFAVPCGLFAAGAVMTSLGVPAPAAVAMLAPIGTRLGREYGISVFVTAVTMMLGASGGTFSPISLNAIVAAQTARDAGVVGQPVMLYLLSIITTAVLSAAVLVLASLTSRSRLQQQVHEPEKAAVPVGAGGDSSPAVADHPADPRPDAAGPAGQPMSRCVAVTLCGFAVVLGAMAFAVDVGIVALSVALVLHLLFPHADSTAGINWDVILMICGLMTFIAVLDRAGTLGRLGEGLTGLDAPVLAAFLLCVAAALVSAFASSPATIGATIPLALPLMTDAGLPVVGLLAAVCLSATLVDASPFSAVGALTVAGAPPDQARRLFRRLVAWGMSMIVVAPVLTIGFFVALPLAF